MLTCCHPWMPDPLVLAAGSHLLEQPVLMPTHLTWHSLFFLSLLSKYSLMFSRLGGCCAKQNAFLLSSRAALLATLQEQQRSVLQSLELLCVEEALWMAVLLL